MPITRAHLRALTKIQLSYGGPKTRLAVLVYKARPASALAKGPSKASLFGERRPSRCYKTKETSPSAPTMLPWTVTLPPMDQDHGELRSAHRHRSRRYVVSLPAKNEREGELERRYKGHFASVEGTANSSCSLPSLNPSTRSHLVV